MKTMQNKLPERAFVSSIHQKLYYSQLNKLGNGIVAHNTFPLPDTRCWLVESFMYLMEKKSLLSTNLDLNKKRGF